MNTNNKATTITVETLVNAPLEKVWTYWTEPVHITKWCQASEEWHAPHADNDLRVNGKFTTTMAAKYGSMSFDFGGVYTNIQPFKEIEYNINDGRKVKIIFSKEDNRTKVIESFEAEDTNPIEMQRGGWQAILDNFRKYTESN